MITFYCPFHGMYMLNFWPIVMLGFILVLTVVIGMVIKQSRK